MRPAARRAHPLLRVLLALALLVAVGITVLATAGSSGGTAAAAHGSAGDLQRAYSKLPLSFVENHGQAKHGVRYHAQGPDYAFSFMRDRVVLSLLRGTAHADGVTLALRFVGANPDAEVRGGDRAPESVNYLHGDDADTWHRGLPAYRSVIYHELWPGIDMVLRGQDGRLKYEFRVRPGARPSDIRLAYDGADGLALQDTGELRIATPVGALRDAAPVAYQLTGGERVRVPSRYAVDDAGTRYGFDVGSGYRADRELVIDPSVDYSTFLGGSSHERSDGIAVDGSGNAYIVGTTQSTDLPTTPGAFDRSFAGGLIDVFVSKLNAAGSALVYSTYLGGTPTPLQRGTGDPFEFGRGIAVDGSGNAYVTGQTTSSDFPTTAGAFDRSINASPRDATDGFVTKLNPAGSGLVYSTFLGGTSLDDPDGIGIDAAGNAYVTGMTTSADFPVTPGAFQATNHGGQDAFVTKLNPAGSALAYSTYLGGAENELGAAVEADSNGNAYVSGGTRSADYPTTAGAFDTTHNGGAFEDLFDVFVTKLNTTGSALTYSTFLGGSKADIANDLAIDGTGSAYVVGGTLSPEFPTTPGTYDQVFTGGSEGFAAKLSPSGANLTYSTFLGGTSAAAVALEPDGRAWVVGGAPAGVLTTPDAFAATNSGAIDAYVARLTATASALDYATYLGGSNDEAASDVARNTAGNVYVTGTTYSPSFPTTVGAFDRVFAGDPQIFWGDAFVTKLGGGAADPSPPPPPPPAQRTTSTFSGTVDANQTAAHTVAVGAQGPVDVSLDWQDTRATLRLRALDPSGGVVLSNTSTAKPKAGTFSATATGSYRIEITNTSSRRTTYTLRVTYPVAAPGPAPPPAAATLTSLGVSPASVTGGASSTGTVTLSAAAPAGGAAVALSSGNPAVATVPASVTVPAGATSATFTASTSAVNAVSSSAISATYAGVTRSATLTVTPPATSTDSVTVSRAEYTSSSRELRVEASSSGSGATLRVHVSATNELIGTLSAGKGTFSWPTNPANITVRSSLGGSGSRAVAAK